MNSSTLVQKLWNHCNVLRDDGMSYGDYVEQLTTPLTEEQVKSVSHQLQQRCRDVKPFYGPMDEGK